jgi:SAM-dependent methyltransferase
MGAGRASGTEGYAESADAVAKAYEAITFAAVHRNILHLIPAAPARVLDIGAGTGRDAAALAALGHSLVAVEPTAELRAHGQRLHPAAAITWIDDALPDLAVLRERGARFNLVMLTAVWMHLDAGQRAGAMRRVADLLLPGGMAALALRHGPVPAGRRMFEVSADETCMLAAENGLETVHRSERGDTQGRDDVHWSVVVFRREPVPAFDRIGAKL